MPGSLGQTALSGETSGSVVFIMRVSRWSVCVERLMKGHFNTSRYGTAMVSGQTRGVLHRHAVVIQAGGGRNELRCPASFTKHAQTNWFWLRDKTWPLLSVLFSCVFKESFTLCVWCVSWVFPSPISAIVCLYLTDSVSRNPPRRLKVSLHLSLYNRM